MRALSLVLSVVLTATLLAGCASGPKDDDASADVARTTGYTAFERVALPFNVTGDYSHTIAKGTYAIKAGEGHFIDVALPLTELGATTFSLEGPQVHLGLFLPDVPAGTKVPVIADVGPYYATSTSQLTQPEGDTVATEPAHRLGGFLIENFVPLGYAVAQVSVFGSGDSNHCFDMFGMAEQLGVDAAVTWLGEQDWSNGNVALIGRSYDGSTPWMAATFGNPHLKTIVPISGLHGLAALVTRNGTSEARAASFQNVVYGQFEVDGDAGDIQAVCPDAIMAGPMGAGALVTGDQVLPMEDSYWAEREFFPRVLENYEGSVYWIHGLQDWNVDPHMISPSFHLLREKGLDVKGLFGQWGHMYPDRPGEHAGLPEGLGAFPYSVRFDWAEDLKEWFDFYLKGEGPKPLLKVEVQDNIGRWRVEDTYPPLDFAEVALQPTGADQTISPASNGAPLDLGVLSETNPVALSGHIYLNAAVTPSGANGQIHFTVRDTESGYRLAFGTMDLRYRGPEQPATIPGQQVIVRVQSEPFDFVVPAGHHLELVVRQTGDGLLPSPSAAPMTFSPAASQVLVPEIDRAPSDYFTPPAWKETATASAPQP